MFVSWWNHLQPKNCGFPGETFFLIQIVSEQNDFPTNIGCVQKCGAYVAQHKHPIIKHNHVGHFWTRLFPSVLSLIRFIRSVRNPDFIYIYIYIYIYFFFFCFKGFMCGTPQNEHQHICGPQQDIKKVKNANKGGSLMFATRLLLKLLFLWLFLGHELTTVVIFDPAMFNRPSSKKNLLLGGIACFSPNTPIMRNGRRKRSMYIYIYMYICVCCRVILWAKFGV